MLLSATPWRPVALAALGPPHRAAGAATVRFQRPSAPLPCGRHAAGAVCAAARPGAGSQTPGRDFASSLALMVLGGE